MSPKLPRMYAIRSWIASKVAPGPVKSFAVRLPLGHAARNELTTSTHASRAPRAMRRSRETVWFVRSMLTSPRASVDAHRFHLTMAGPSSLDVGDVPAPGRLPAQVVPRSP